MSWTDLIEFLQQPEPAFPGLRFKFAKTMAAIPHSYVIRCPENDREFEALSDRIAEQGVLETWKDGRQYQYLYLGNYKYWAMPIGGSDRPMIINRAQAKAV
jgi:hypothetical protein